MRRIGVISDTHGLLREEILEELKTCDAILHAGDIHKPKILERISGLAPVYAVRGNADKEWGDKLPETAAFTLYGIRFFMIHNKKQIREDLSDRDVVIYGHSHKYEEIRRDGKLWLNPGSCGPRRFTQPITMAVLEIGEDRNIHVQKVEISHAGAGAGEPLSVSAENVPKSVVESVIRDVTAGRAVSEIAKRNKLEEKLAEQICRLYVTHPGIDAEGVMEKMRIRW